MKNVDLFSMKQIAKAIKELDKFRNSEEYVGSDDNVLRLDDARKNLINVIFSNGYEVKIVTYTLIKSKIKRKLI